jgi:hypothetical protein
MPDSKVDTPPTVSHEFDEELQYLYARKAAVDALIASLEQYRQYQHVPGPRSQRKTA